MIQLPPPATEIVPAAEVDDDEVDDEGAPGAGSPPTDSALPNHTLTSFVSPPEGNAEAKKKKKKKKPKKKGPVKPVQSDPPRVGLSQFFPDGVYPVGEIHEYKDDNTWRTTSEEKRHLEKLAMEDPETTYESIRKAAETHRLVRQHARKTIRPGMTLTEIAEEIEAGVRALSEGDGLEAGVGFPTGLNINNCAAHFSPNAGDKTVLKMGDIMKVDIGVHVKGRICDSAFTLSWAPEYDQLLEAVKAATNTGIREAGIDVRLGELGGLIQETMESYEVEIGGKVYPVKPISSLGGHTILPYSIHGGSKGKFVPLVKTNSQTRMEEGDYFAIETFGSTGTGRVDEHGECSHYAKLYNAPNVPLRLTSAKSLLKTINKHFGTLPFARRYLDRLGERNYLLGLNNLVAQGIVQDYPPLCDQIGSMTAQFEHTIFLRPTCKEVVSRGDDY
ncbi:Methionine aminopeptidase 2 [Mycena chlorophos]|uniref:Methionine aminopeptidase 2 n=1 Tax=Mycena chlorophos TaxID=658473 RepID=A0A8H6SZT1_MYCCL|nr:Methionine aminopeptidase 2 [Mycena chlorophos]